MKKTGFLFISFVLGFILGLGFFYFVKKAPLKLHGKNKEEELLAPHLRPHSI